MIKVLDLFSCIGCHHLGLSRAGGFETIAFVESNEWRRDKLRRNFPGIPIYNDVKTFDGSPTDVVFGGPPCQGTSIAAAISGKRTGFTLWPEMLRIGLNSGAKWFIVEQPPGNAQWEAEVAADLSRVGYHVGKLEFGACDLGAPYPRKRVFMVASSMLKRLEIAWQTIPSAIDHARRTANARGDWNPNSIPAFGVDTWRSERVHDRQERIKACGDSNPPAMAEVIGYILQAGIS